MLAELKERRDRMKPKEKRLDFDTNTSLGITFKGTKVKKVDDESQADKAGVQKGWYIIAINGKKQPDDEKAIDANLVAIKEAKKPYTVLFSTDVKEPDREYSAKEAVKAIKIYDKQFRESNDYLDELKKLELKVKDKPMTNKDYMEFVVDSEIGRLWAEAFDIEQNYKEIHHMWKTIHAHWGEPEIKEICHLRY